MQQVDRVGIGGSEPGSEQAGEDEDCEQRQAGCGERLPAAPMGGSGPDCGLCRHGHLFEDSASGGSNPCVPGCMVNGMMSLTQFCRALILAAAVGLGAEAVCAQSGDEQRLLDFANQARAQAGIAPLRWDAALAGAAHAHALRMAQEGTIAHRYDGEADLAARAAVAGAHFSLIEENVAMGPSVEQIHDGWMHSPGHHDNLLNPKVDSLGVALVPAHGVLFAVADYSQAVAALSPQDVEAKVGAAVAQHGVALVAGGAGVDGARQYCALEDGKSSASLGLKARFLMKWQSADIAKLPPELEKALASRQFTQAAVGACEAKGGGGAGFSAYRVAVLLF